MRKIAFSSGCILILLLTACTPPAPGDLINMDGTKMYLNCMGTGTTTVVMEAGLNDVAETWNQVQPKVADVTRVCTYDRAGLGHSDPVSEPRDSYQIVNGLHTLLENADIEGPYVLVGHSLGGMYMRLFADVYSDEVVGLVLVDSAHIEDAERCRAALPPESPYERENLRLLREYLANPLTFPELPQRLFEPGSLGNLPLVVLSVPHQQRPEDLPVEFRVALDEIWVDLQKEWAQISTNSMHIFVEDSGHFIQKDQPDQVIDAILQVLEAARHGL